MDVAFYGATHLKTLGELVDLAEKHNCRINFGVRHYTDDDTDFSNYNFFFPKDIAEDMEKCGTIESGSYVEAMILWFELYDRDKDHYNVMEYIERAMRVHYTPYASEEMQSKTEEWISENKSEYEWDVGEHTFLYQGTETRIRGFEGIEHPDVYREGMTVKFFGDLVCDYLGEERISRVY